MLHDEHLRKSDKVLLLDTFKTYLTTALEDQTDNTVPGQTS